MIMGAYCVGKVYNILPQDFYYNWSILCNKVHYMQTWWFYDNGSILCR